MGRQSGGSIQEKVPSVLPPGQKLWLLTLSRCPAAARELLLWGKELEACRNKLLWKGCKVELISGALAFVRPETFFFLEFAAPAAANLLGVKLMGKHIFCSCEFEPLVRQVVGRLKGRDHVRIKSKEEVDCDVQMPAMVNLGRSVLFRRNTFLELSPADSRSVMTASTTDAKLGTTKNPRKLEGFCNSEG